MNIRDNALGKDTIAHMTRRLLPWYSSEQDISCACPSVVDVALPCLALGVLLGVVATKCMRNIPLSRKEDSKICVDGDSRSNSKKSKNPPYEKEHEVLTGAVSLFSSKFSTEERKFKLNEKDNNSVMMVDYLAPEDMLKTLFYGKDSKNSGDNSLSLDHALGSHKKEENMIQLLQQIQNNSVNTNHPYFFNQLFGALDPIALAAELVSLSVHTSAYTFEVAPVFTLMEIHVIEKLAKLVYGENISNGHDGLMLPGGSLSNLTALHVARHVSTSRTPYDNLVRNEERQSEYSLQEEKKDDLPTISSRPMRSKPTLVAFVSSEAHYSFGKSVKVAGIGAKNIVNVPTLLNGQMDLVQLDLLMTQIADDDQENKVPFFVGATAGSTVRGSFDDIDGIVKICRKHELRLNNSRPLTRRSGIEMGHKIWVHVDGAWGGSAIFSPRKDISQLLNGVSKADSFTFNPHKMLGAPQQTTAFVTRHQGVLKASNSTSAKYLFDKRKNGAEFDLGDGSYTCGRKPDAVKLWAQWKYYGTDGLAKKIEAKVDAIAEFSSIIKKHDHFMLACEPWAFNVNFFYLPERMRKILKERNVDIYSDNSLVPEDLSSDLANIHVEIKTRLHESGEMFIPFQPLSNQTADCFRIVLAGNKKFDKTDMINIMDLMEKTGAHL